MHQENNSDNFSNDLSLKEVIEKVLIYYKELILNWKKILFIITLFIGLFFIKHFLKSKIYTASLTFMVNEEKGTDIGGLGSLASSFGFGGGLSEYNLSKIMDLSRSRTIIEKVLFDSINYKNKYDFIANRIIDEYDYHEEWEDDTTGLKNFIFFDNKVKLFTRTQNKALKKLHKEIIGNPEKSKKGLFMSQINEETGIMKLLVESTSEDLSIHLVKNIYKRLSEFYINKTIEKQEQTFFVIKSKTDSLQNTLNLAQYQYLKFQDTNRGLSLRQFEAEEYRLKQKIQILSIAYTEALKNLETADFALKTKTPFIQAIDFPIEPLEHNKKPITYLINVLIGGILGCIFAIFYVIGKKIINESLA